MKAMYGVFLLDTQTIWTPQAGSSGLGDPPAGLAGFRKFGDTLVGSERVASAGDGMSRPLLIMMQGRTARPLSPRTSQDVAPGHCP